MSRLAYHATSPENARRILERGFRAGAYFANEDLVGYYEETVREEGGGCVVIVADLDELEARFGPHLEPDRGGIEEPISTVIGMSEEEVRERWGSTDRSWSACFDLIGSFRCAAPVPPDLLWREEAPSPD